MAFRVGAELSKRVAAIASVSGRLWLNNPKPQRAVSLIYLIGSEDPFNPLHETSRGAAQSVNEKPSARESALKWAELLGCALQPKATHDQDGVQTIDYQPCKEESEVLFYTIEGMGHTWPGGNNRLPEWMVGKTTNTLPATDVIWEFFRKHPIE
jgi:polyhydroxybutyrate depolymerase